MPPRGKKERPPAAEAAAVTKWLRDALVGAEAKAARDGRTGLRRLTRVEYENTVRDLLGVDVDLKEQLPQDGSADGFDNVGAALHTSSFLMEKYLEAADKALTLAIANRPKPKRIDKRVYCRDERQVARATQEVFRQIDDIMNSALGG